ncbi:MAG: hypothetical protein ACRDRS_21105 [Pseudonocardiaceae bacterium]
MPTVLAARPGPAVPRLHTGPGGATSAEVDYVTGKHRARHAWWRRRYRGHGGAHAQARSRLAGVTDAGTLVEHLTTGDAAADGRGRYVAVCGARVLRAEPETVPELRFCPACVGGAA